MELVQALQQRQSVRAFLPEVPSAALVREVIEGAALAASGGNLQPWRVEALTGAPLAELLDVVAQAEREDDAHNPYPPNLWEPYRSRRFENGEDLYRSLGIGRDNKPARLQQLAKNAQFFGAPVGVFIYADERMGLPQWLDIGIYLQSLMLLATDKGLATCAQGFWRHSGKTVAAHLGWPEGHRMVCGVALGYADPNAPINQWRSPRAPFDEWAAMRGF